VEPTSPKTKREMDLLRKERGIHIFKRVQRGRKTLVCERALGLPGLKRERVSPRYWISEK